MVLTSSLWGSPPTRFYRFLKRIEAAARSRPSLAVIGCADGKFVLPAARRGFQVFAADIDEVALFGGHKTDASGRVHMPGLAERLRVEQLADRVEISKGDFLGNPLLRTFDAVFTSGTFQYSNNIGRELAMMVECVGSGVRRGGHYYIDYMLPYEEKYRGRTNCPERDWWHEHFASQSHWNVLYHRVLPPTIDRAHIEYPVDHYHQWGHILCTRNQ